MLSEPGTEVCTTCLPASGWFCAALLSLADYPTPNYISVEFFQNSVLRGTIPIMLPRTHGWHEEKHASQLAELARALVRLDHVATVIVDANHSIL
jgi:hypothetical protein